MRLSLITSIAVVAATLSAPAFGQSSNEFFGSGVGGSATDGVPGATAAANALSGSPTDYTVDEKRMQKKFKANLRSASGLIAKGESMMKSKDPKVAKKGKILMEIGQKRVAELKANSPFPELAEKEGSKIH